MERNENKRFQRNGSCIFDYDYKKETSQKIGVYMGTDFAGEFEKLSESDGIQFYSRMSENKAAFAERTIRSLKKYFTVTWKKIDTRTFTNRLNSLQD